MEAGEKQVLATAQDRTDARVMLVAPWDAHIARYHHTVVVALLSHGIGLERAQELAQDVWMRLMHQQTQGLLKTLELPGLALAQARFLALAELRRVRAHLEVPDDGQVDSGARHVPGQEERLLSREVLERVLRALEKENPQTRRIFECVYDDPGLPHATIAAEVGLSVQRVRQILCEVRKRLRDVVPEHDR